MSKRVTMLLCLVILWLFSGSMFHPSSFAANDQEAQLFFHEWPLPKTLTLCGETMPIENQAVLEMLDRELTFFAWDRAQVFMWIKRAGRFFPFIEEKLRLAGMPDDLKYLAVVESSLLTDIRSSAGALGLWQFIAQTGTNNGLRRDPWVDERLDFERSTEAAIKYLQNLKDMFSSWTLALAAYNCGEVRLKKEIEEQKVSDYYRLDLPRETERFIFRIGAAKLILENPERYGYIVDKEKIYKPIQSDRVPVNISEPIHISEVASSLGTDFKVIKELNPQIQGYHLPTGCHTLRVPAGLGTKMAEILPNCTPATEKTDKVSDQYYIVQPGDTLGLIANKMKVPVDLLRKINGIQGSHITVGQKLRLTS